jgi:hypothetical protein
MNLKHLPHHFLFHSPFGINGQKNYSYHLHVTPPLHFITSYFIHITCISSLLIISYFTPPLASMDKKIIHDHHVEWHWKSLSPVCMKPNSSISS